MRSPKLVQFLKAAAEAVRDVVKPIPKDTGDGPQSLKELFRIGADPVPNERPRVAQQAGTVDTNGPNGRWHVTARIRLKPRRNQVRLFPAVYFLAKTGADVAMDGSRWRRSRPAASPKGEACCYRLKPGR